MVRLQVARRIDPSRLHEMMGDEDWSVRLEVARRIHPSRLPEMMLDPDWRVRFALADKIPSKYLNRSFSLVKA